MPVRFAAGRLHVETQQADARRTEKKGEIYGLVAAVSTSVDSIKTKPITTFTRDECCAEVSGRVLAPREPKSAECAPVLLVGAPPFVVAGIEGVCERD